MSEFIPRSIPRVKIALYGPSGAGKTLFFNIFLKGDSSDPEPTKEAQVSEILREYRRITSVGITESVEKYKLTLVDVPGADELRESRLKFLQKVVGWLFMYDATDPRSPELLLKMLKEELITERKLKSAIGIMVIGTKSDLGINDMAVRKGEEIVEFLSKNTMASVYGYKIPHIQISVKDREQVRLTYLCLESIVFDLKPSDIILSKLKKVVEKGVKPLETPARTELREESIKESGIEAPAEAISKEIKGIETKAEEKVSQEAKELGRLDVSLELMESQIEKEKSTAPHEPISIKQQKIEKIERLAEEPTKKIMEKVESISEKVSPKPRVDVEREKIRESVKKLVEETKGLEKKPMGTLGVSEKMRAGEVMTKEQKISAPVVRIFSSDNKEALKLASIIAEKYPIMKNLYILEKKSKMEWAVAYDVTNIVLNDKKMELLSSVASFYEVAQKYLGANACAIMTKDRVLSIVGSNKKLYVAEMPHGNLLEILAILLSTGERQAQGETKLLDLANFDLPMSLHEDAKIWRFAKKLRWLSPDIESVLIVEKEESRYKLAHDGPKFLSDYHKSLVLLQDAIVQTLKKIKPLMLLIFGTKTLLILTNAQLSRALIFVFSKRPEIQLITTILSAAS